MRVELSKSKSMRNLIVVPSIFFGLPMFFLFSALSLEVSLAGSDPISRTESICNVGMVKGEKEKGCTVPIPAGCTVASFPGYDEPWADISKGGRISCRFDEQKTDWKTKIVGMCGKCVTDQCSARFSVMFNCSTATPSTQTPRR